MKSVISNWHIFESDEKTFKQKRETLIVIKFASPFAILFMDSFEKENVNNL